MEREFLTYVMKIYDQIDAVYYTDAVEDTYEAIKTKGLFENILGERGSYQQMTELLREHCSYKNVLKNEQYENFFENIIAFRGKSYQNLRLIDGDEYVLAGISCYEVDDKKYLLIMNILDEDINTYDTYNSEKEKTIGNSYLFAMRVNLDKDSFSNISMSEIEEADESFKNNDTSYSKWREMIVNMIHPDYQAAFLEYSSEASIREYLGKSRSRTLICLMANLEGNMIWVRLIWNRIDRQEEDFCFVYMVEDINESHSELMDEFAKVEEQARRDSLTGLLNRRVIQQALVDTLENVAAERQTNSMIMFDIDHFKLINDSYGHAFGDKVLVALSQIALQYLNEFDCDLGRWGGEEFIIILRNKTKDEAAIIAEKLRNLFEQHVFNNGIIVTSSFGVIDIEGNEKAKEAFKRVDKVLYEAKRCGRNRVICG